MFLISCYVCISFIKPFLVLQLKTAVWLTRNPHQNSWFYLLLNRLCYKDLNPFYGSWNSRFQYTKMDNSLRIQQIPQIHSALDINRYGDNDPFKLKQCRTRSLPSIRLRHGTQSSPALEYLYRITDRFLVLCGIIFVLSSIAYTSLWVYAALDYKLMKPTTKFVSSRYNLSELRRPEKIG